MLKSPCKKSKVSQHHQQSPRSVTPATVSQIAHIKIHTKEDPIPTNIRQLEPKGFIALRSKVFY